MKHIISFEIARGFTILFMPAIHVAMLYSEPGISQTLLGHFLTFIAEGPGAQLFMLLMGVYFKPAGALKRAFKLLLLGYSLNLFKFVIPYWLGVLPGELTAELQATGIKDLAIFFFGIGDILHFASIAIVVLCILHQLKFYPFIAAALSIFIIFLSPLLWDETTGINVLDYFAGLFNGHPPAVFFPVFPWLAYPLAGLTLGYFLRREEASRVIKVSGSLGILLLVISLGLPATLVLDPWPGFYRTRPADSFFHLGLVLTWLALFHWLTGKVRSNPFFDLLRFCSRHITAIYIIQWLLICWCLPVTGYGELNQGYSLVWMLGITALTLSLTYILFYVRKKS